MSAKMSRASALEVLLRPLPPPLEKLGMQRAVGVRIRIEQVYGALPFLDDEEQARAREWLRIAEDDQRQYQGKLTWQENRDRC